MQIMRAKYGLGVGEILYPKVWGFQTKSQLPSSQSIFILQIFKLLCSLFAANDSNLLSASWQERFEWNNVPHKWVPWLTDFSHWWCRVSQSALPKIHKETRDYSLKEAICGNAWGGEKTHPNQERCILQPCQYSGQQLDWLYGFKRLLDY